MSPGKHPSSVRTKRKPAIVGREPPAALFAALMALSGSALCAADPVHDARPNVALASTLSAMPVGESTPARPTETAISSSEETSAPPSRWASGTELSGGSYRFSAYRGALDVGMNFRPPVPSGKAYDLRSEQSGPIGSNLPSLSLGLRRTAGQVPTASSLLERATGNAGAASYVSRIGLEWKPAQSQVNFLREGLGIRLDGNDRMSVRLRKGVLGLYMHRKF